MSLTLTPEQRQTVHPLWLRLTHWLNALAMLIMVTSGWRIYNASPLFNFSFFNELTLGAGWAARCSGTLPACGCLASTGCATCC